MKASSEKLTAITQYQEFVSSGKVEFFKKYGMDLFCQVKLRDEICVILL